MSALDIASLNCLVFIGNFFKDLKMLKAKVYQELSQVLLLLLCRALHVICKLRERPNPLKENLFLQEGFLSDLTNERHEDEIIRMFRMV